MGRDGEGMGDTGRKEIRLLTFNTWGLKYVSKLRKQRLEAIAERLGQGSGGQDGQEGQDGQDDDYDIVALQEVWCEEDWNYISHKCLAKYPYQRKFKSGMITGPGLAILSKIPIESTFLYRFPINGRPSAFFRGDWLVGKSVAVTVLRPTSADLVPIAVLNSHMHAPYGPSGDNSYSCHRACQAWDFSQLIKVMKAAGYAVIQVGDLNSKPGSLPYKLFTTVGGLLDSWDACRGKDETMVVTSEELATMKPIDQVVVGGITCDSQLNTWRAQRQRWEACRLDYALIDPARIQPVRAKVVFTELLPPPYNCSYSDHFAYSVDLVVAQKNRTFQHDLGIDPAEKLGVYQEMLAELETYQQFTIPFQARWRKWHFFLSVVVVIGIHIGISFAANVRAYSSVILLLFSTVIGITGVINGLIWFLGVRSELRAISEVQLEVEDQFVSEKRQ